MRALRISFLVVVAFLTLSVATIAGLAAVTFATAGGGFRGSEWLVGLGFGAMWLSVICILLLAIIASANWIKRRLARANLTTVLHSPAEPNSKPRT